MWYSPAPPPEIHLSGATDGAKIHTVEKDGRWFTVRWIDASHGEIISMRSMMPQDYLNPAWRPGQILSWADIAEMQDHRETPRSVTMSGR